MPDDERRAVNMANNSSWSGLPADNDITSGTSAIVESMHRTTRIPISELNRHLLCALCSGYLIDATTIIECLHSFCKTCILRYLETSKYCPICDVQVHKTKPHVNIRSDHTLQNVVYKLVPNLFKQEMHMRRVFYVANPTAGPSKSSVNALEARGEMSASDRGIITEDDKISLILQRCSELPPYKNGVFFTPAYKDEGADQRYLRCPAGINISHLKKFLKLKFELAEQFQIEIFHSDESLNDKYSLMDVAYIYGWRRLTPLKLYYIAIDMSKDKIDLAALSHPSLYMYHISLMRSRKRKKSSISTAASTPTVGTSDDEAPVPKVQRANNNDDKALFRPISCDAGSRASPADGAAARSPTITSLLTSSVSSSFVSRSGLTKAAISHAVVAVRTSPVVHAHNTFRTSTPLSRQDVGGGSKRSVQIDTPQPRRGAVVGDAAGSSPMTSQTPESAAASSTSLPPNGRSASKKGTVSGKQKDGPEKEKKKKKDKEKVKNKSVSSSTGLVQIRRALPKDMVNAKPSTSHKGNCDSSNAFASLITTSSVSGTPSTTITASLSTPKSNSDTVSGTKKRSPTVTIRMVKTQDGEKVFSVERTSYDDSGSDTCIEDNVPSPPPPCVPTSEPSAAPKDTTEAAPAKHTSDGNATALGTSSDAAVSSVSTAISKIEETVMLKTAGTVNVSATNTSSQCKVTAVSAPNSTNLTNVSKDNINATAVFGLATSSPALDKAAGNSSTSSEKSQASNVLSNSGTMSKSVQNQSNVIPVLDRIASEKAATDKAASEKAQMISDKMATYKLIKPKASLNKEKSINAIASVLGEKKNIKNKSKTANVKDSKPAKQAKRKNDDVIVTSCFKQYNAMQRDPLAVNTGTSESAAKPSPNMIPSLSSPRSATCVSSSETQFLGSDKGVTLSTMDPSELIVTSAGIQNNNHKPPSMENVAVEENDSPVLVNSKPPASREDTYKLMGPPPSMCTPHPLPSIGQTKVIKLNGPKNPITSPSVTAAVSTTPSTLKLPTHINPAEMQNYQAPQPCKRRGTYAKRPTKAALAAMNQAAGKPSKMAKMAETLNARRGRQPIPIPGRAPDRSMFDMRRLPANLGPMNPNVIQQAMQTVMMGHTLNGSQAMPAMMSPNGIHYMPPGNLQVPAVSMMTDRPGTPMVPGHSAPGAVLHQAMTSPPASHAPANARLSTPLSLASNGKSPLASPSAFSSPPIHTFMSPTHTPLANRPPFNGIPPNAPPTAQPNGYDAPLDFTTKRSSLPDSGKSPPKAHMSPAEKRTLLKVPNPMANRL